MEKALSVDEVVSEKTNSFSKQMKKIIYTAGNMVIGSLPGGLYYVMNREIKEKKVKRDTADKISDYMFCTCIEFIKGMLYYDFLIKPIYEKFS